MDTELEADIGFITFAPRDRAALLLNRILEVEENYNNFEILKDAVFVVCIDEALRDKKNLGKLFLCSKGENRYFDKSIQLIFTQDGNLGFNLEHTGADGTPWIKIIDEIGNALNSIENYLKYGEGSEIQLEELEWIIDDGLKYELRKLKAFHMERAENIYLDKIKFEDFGKKRIKSLGYSPDAFFHAALQLAQYRTFNRIRGTSEAVSTRLFLDGRTECNRPVSIELVKFVTAFEEKGFNCAVLKQLMEQALKKHRSRISDCQIAKGVERHLFGLLCMYKMFGQDLGINVIPEIFQDESYKILKHDFISTSRMESKYSNFAGFAPVASDGFGLWYSFTDNSINMSLTTKKDANVNYVKPFTEAIIKSLIDLERLALE